MPGLGGIWGVGGTAGVGDLVGLEVVETTQKERGKCLCSFFQTQDAQL